MTKTFTVTDTIYMHSATAAPGGNSAAPAANSVAPAAFAAGASSLPITVAPANLAATSMAANEPTTTLTTTSTSTETITVEMVSTNGANEAAATNLGGMGGACSIVTVTTVLQSTIYVTASPSTAAAPAMLSPAPAMSSQSVSVAVADIQSSISAILASVSSITNPTPAVTSSMASALPASFFGQGNSTVANSTKYKLAGTGFMTLSSGSAMPTGYKL
jgi:hypothetical protein